MAEKKITADMSIEELVELVPGSVTYLLKKNVRCIACGEPTWATIAEASKQKNYTDEDIQGFVDDLNEMYEKQNNQ